MNKIFAFMLILLSALYSSQNKNDSTYQEYDDDTEMLIIKETKYIDSIRILKEKEISKQINLITKIKEVKEIRKLTTKKTLEDTLNIDDKILNYGVKNDNDNPEFWEEIPNYSFNGNVTGPEVRIRKYTYVNGMKVYKG